MTDEQRDAVCILAHVYLRNGRADLALPLLMALCSLFPRDGSALALLSWALLANGDGRAASRAATEACMLKLSPGAETRGLSHQEQGSVAARVD